jgi:hypothetical protein
MTYTETATDSPKHYGEDHNTHIVFANPGDWNGTYGIVLVVLLTDLLADGETIPVRIIHESEDGGRGIRLSTGDVRKVDNEWITFVGGSVIRTDNVLSLAVLGSTP